MKNVDVSRSISNFYCVAAGEDAWLDPNDPCHISEFWKCCKELVELYWQNRATAWRLACRHYPEHLAYIRQFSRSLYKLSGTPAGAMIMILLHLALRLWKRFTTASMNFRDFQNKQRPCGAGLSWQSADRYGISLHLEGQTG